MLLKAEFESNMGFLDPTIEAMLAAGEGKDEYSELKVHLPHQLARETKWGSSPITDNYRGNLFLSA